MKFAPPPSPNETKTASDGEAVEEPLGVENTLWANTVLASGTAVGVVVYTGSETRSVMNTSAPRSKVKILSHFFSACS